MKQIITIENENKLNKADWKKYTKSPAFRAMTNKISTENPGCQIEIAPYKTVSESKMRSFDNMVKESQTENNLTSGQLDDFFAAANKRQLPSSMR